MATNAEKRARREASRARERHERRRRVVMMSALGVGAVLVAAVAILVPLAARAGRIVVSVGPGTTVDAVRPLVADAIEAQGNVTVGDRSYRLLFDASARRPDVTLASVGPPPDLEAARDTSRLVAIDPYLLAVDRRSGLIVDSRAPLEALLSGLTSLVSGPADGGATPPLVVAGDEPLDFAAFMLYLAAELLSPEDYDAVLRTLPDEAAPVEPAIARMRPVIGRLNLFRSIGIVAVNWTDWDAIAVRDAMARDDASAFFVARSQIKEMSAQARFNVDLYRLPAGSGKLTYALAGRAVAFESAGGARSDDGRTAMLDALATLVRSDDVQTGIERDTDLSPVALSGEAINAEHRDVVRWFRSAAAYVAIDETTASHPFFRELHRMLR